MDISLGVVCPKCKKSEEILTEKDVEKIVRTGWECKDTFKRLKKKWSDRSGAFCDFEKKGDYEPGENGVYVAKFFCADCMVCFVLSADISYKIME